MVLEVYSSGVASSAWHSVMTPLSPLPTGDASLHHRCSQVHHRCSCALPAQPGPFNASHLASEEGQGTKRRWKEFIQKWLFSGVSTCLGVQISLALTGDFSLPRSTEIPSKGGGRSFNCFFLSAAFSMFLTVYDILLLCHPQSWPLGRRMMGLFESTQNSPARRPTLPKMCLGLQSEGASLGVAACQGVAGQGPFSEDVCLLEDLSHLHPIIYHPAAFLPQPSWPPPSWLGSLGVGPLLQPPPRQLISCDTEFAGGPGGTNHLLGW